MSHRKEIIGDCTLYLGDCLEVMPTLGKVDAVVTSPPYAQQRDYGQKISDWRSLVSCAMTSLQNTEKTQFIINLGLVHREGRVFRYWDDLIIDMEKAGYRLFGWYVWDQCDGLPGNWNGRLAPSHEFIFHFNKENPPSRKWVKSKNPRKASGTGLRGKDGKMTGISSPDLCGQTHKVNDSVFRVYRQMDRSGIESNHPAIFPVNFACELIQSFSDHGQTILDPFMGSGTTGVACVKLGRKFIGIELDERYFDIACRRIEEAYKQPDFFISPPEKKPVQDDLL